MPLSAGEKLGPYEIVAPIGAGGMGEVYKATDTRLGRDVAIKVSAKQFSERFEREARAIAALNHPNICTLFDVGPNYLVMELVEGPTLAERIKEGAIPLDEALKIAQQIGAALECAHELPIIHRDLKPANIKIKPDGVVKVLDFGLAKMGSDAPADSDATITLGATEAGAILGTPAYMAPEQARGKPLTKSADIWAFGVVFHEMLTGQRTFVGDDITMTLASVVMKDPDLAPIPQKVRRLLKKCLEKDPKKRLHDIADVWDYLEEGGLEPVQAFRPVSKVPWIVAAAAIVALIAVTALAFYPRPSAPTAGAIRFTLPPPDGATITVTNGGAPQISLSPDGRYLAFVADETGKERTLWVRALGSLSAQKLDKTEGAGFPFWSPDSQHIAFFADNKLKRIPVSGGSPVNIADAGVGDGGTWWQEGNGEGVIVFAPTTASPLLRVPASGGRPTPFTKLAEGETAHIFPQFLPDGKRILYFARGGSKPGIYVQTLGSEERTFVAQTPGRAVFSPPNFLLFLSGTTLMAQRLDLASLKLQGEPVSVADEVRNGGSNGRNSFSVSSNGMLAYRAGGGGGQLRLAWYSRDGKSTGVALPVGPNGPFELSPDDKRVVIRRGDGTEQDLWLLELATGVFSRLTSSPGNEFDPVWAPDSQRIAFMGSAAKGGTQEIREAVIGSGKETIVYSDGMISNMEDWTRDGKQLLVRAGNKVFVIPAPEEGSGKAAERKAQLVLDAPFPTDEIQVSPDGKWVAYMSQESGRPEVNVAAFPSFTNRRQISTAGAAEPRWRADGKELFFRGGSGIVLAVDVKSGATLEIGPIRTLFQGSPITSPSTTAYAVTRDGQRFLMLEPQGLNTNTVEQLYVVANWPALVK